MKAMIQTLLVAITFCGCAMDANEEAANEETANEETEVQAVESEVTYVPNCTDLETNCDRMGGSFHSSTMHHGWTNVTRGQCEFPNGQTQTCQSSVSAL